MLEDGYTAITRTELMRKFGTAFADAVFGLEPGAWQGPVRSGYGLHLVKVTDEQAAELPVFSEIRDRVREAYLDERRHRENEEALRKMMAAYRIMVQHAPDER